MFAAEYWCDVIMDTIIVIMILACPVSVQDTCQVKEKHFEQRLREASKQAVRSAHEKTRKEREKVLNSWNLLKIKED